MYSWSRSTITVVFSRISKTNWRSLPTGVLQQRPTLGDHRRQTHQLDDRRVRFGVGQQLLGQLGPTLHGVADDLVMPDHFSRFSVLGQFEAGGDDLEEIVELMGNRRGDPAQRLHVPARVEDGLGLQNVGQVGADDRCPLGFVVDPNRADVDPPQGISILDQRLIPAQVSPAHVDDRLPQVLPTLRVVE
jgi:hypothetical protein